MIRNPIDISTRVTPRLSELMERLVNKPDLNEAPTLGTVRNYFMGLLPSEFNEAERPNHFDVSESLVDELNSLIGEFGEYAPAADFIRASASEALTRVIETVVNDENREGAATLEMVREALAEGLGARLVGEGVLDEDEDDALLAEIEGLIEQYGADELAENFLRYE
jgi:Arc/MetJ-type ribon-helix-helix transcriptional regulator